MNLSTRLSLAALLACGSAAQTPAQDATWLGDFAANWQDPTQWNPAVVPDGTNYRWIVGNGLAITAGQADAGGLDLDGSGMVVGSGGAFVLDGQATSGLLALNANLSITNGGLVELRNIDLDPSDAPFGPSGILQVNGGTLRLRENAELTLIDPTWGFSYVEIEVNSGRLEFVDASLNRTTGLGLVTQIGTNAVVSIDLANTTDEIYLNEQFAVQNNQGLVELGDGIFYLNEIRGRFALSEGGTMRAWNDFGQEQIQIRSGSELLMAGGTLDIDTSSLNGLENRGTIRGRGEILLGPNSAYVGNFGSALIADDPTGPLTMRGTAGFSNYVAQFSGLAKAENGGTLVFDGVETYQLGFFDVIADQGTVEIKNTPQFTAGAYTVMQGGLLRVGPNATAFGVIDLRDGGVVEVQAGGTLDLQNDNGVDVAVEAGGLLDVAGTLRFTGFSNPAFLGNAGLIDLQPEAGDAGQLALRFGLSLGFDPFALVRPDTGVLDLGDRTDRPVISVADQSFTQVVLVNRAGHTIRGSGVFENTSANGRVRVQNYGLIESAGDNPLVFLGEQAFTSPSELQFELFAGGVLRAAEGTTVRIENANFGNPFQKDGLFEVYGRVELHNAVLAVDQLNLFDGAELIYTGSTTQNRIFARNWNTTGNVQVTVDGPRRQNNNGYIPTINITQGSVLGPGAVFDIRTGSLGLEHEPFTTTAPAVNDGDIYIGPSAKLEVENTPTLLGQGSIHFNHGNAQAVRAPNFTDAFLTTTNNIVGFADLSNLRLTLGGEFRSTKSNVGTSIQLKTLDLMPTATLYAYLDPPHNTPRLVVSDGGEVAGALVIMTGPVPYGPGERSTIIQIDDYDPLSDQPMSGGFDLATVFVDPQFDPTTTTEVTPGVRFLIDYQPGFIDVMTVLSGDANADDAVDQIDLDLVLSAFGSSTPAAGIGTGDLSGDGWVGHDDLTTVIRGWTSSTAPVFDVPEPSVGLLLIAGLGLAGRRRVV